MNLDVLEHILRQLDAADLVDCASVSRTFLAAALPLLYNRIEYTLHHAKRDATTMSPFATLATHPHLVVHVKRIAVHAVPILNHSVSPPFLNDLAHTLRTATNLRAFVCTINIVPPLLPHIIDKPRLHHLRIAASLGSRQTSLLQHTSRLHSLALDAPSWTVIGALPNWSASMQCTLAHLTLFTCQDLDPSVLNATLAQLPRLRGLHVIGCPRITHPVLLTALSHTPDLLELSLTIFPSQDHLPPLNFPTPPLTHLSIDIRASYPALKPLIARIVSRLTPRQALAICGAWIGEIKGSTEHTDPSPPNPGPDGPGQTDNFFHGHFQVTDNPPPNHNHNTTNVFFGFSLDPDGNNGDSNNPPNPGPDPSSPFLVSSLPSTLSVLHLPLLSPAALREVVERCQDIQILGIIVGSAFSSPSSAKSTKTTNRSAARSAARLKHATVTGIRPEISLLASILSRARSLRELIIDTANTDFATSNPSHSRSDGSHGAFRGTALLTPLAVRTLMRESPLLRRVVGEGRIWESPTPTPSSPVPFPHCLTIDLKLSRARHGPGATNHHGHGPPGLGSPGSGSTQIEVENDHWFWLTGSASRGRRCSGT